jgi:hypothetical protein
MLEIAILCVSRSPGSAGASRIAVGGELFAVRRFCRNDDLTPVFPPNDDLTPVFPRMRISQVSTTGWIVGERFPTHRQFDLNACVAERLLVCEGLDRADIERIIKENPPSVKV